MLLSPSHRALFRKPQAASGTFLASSMSSADTTTYTFSSLSFGAAHDERWLLATVWVLGPTSGRTISSVTIGGRPASAAITVEGNDGTFWGRSAIYLAKVSDGLSGDVVVTVSAAADRAGVGLWRITGLQDPNPRATSSATASPFTAALRVEEQGFAVGVIGGYNGGGAPTYTWAGVTEGYDATAEGFATTSGGIVDSRSPQVLTITATPSLTLTAAASFVAATFR